MRQDAHTAPVNYHATQFLERGYAGPVQILSAGECRQFLHDAPAEGNPPPLDWYKGHAVTSRAFYEMGTHPAVLEVVTALLGEDIMLWGASLLIRKPAAIHPWHSDIETAEVSGKTVTVWIGLEHTHRDSSLLVIPGSHRFGVSVQEARHRHGKGRDETTDDDIVRWAQERDSRCQLVKEGVVDGEALFFDGRLWHASHNLFSETRRALLLQYATPDAEIRMPDLKNLDWPFHRLDSPKPPCLMVRGSDKAGVNRIAPGPAANGKSSAPRPASRIHPVQLPLPTDETKDWKYFPIFNGPASGLQNLSCHVSTLKPRCIPHPPHQHNEEEILLLLAGEVDLLLPGPTASNGTQRKRLRPGELVYYPTAFAHTLETVSEQPANYLMFKWRDDSASAKAISPLTFQQIKLFDRAAISPEAGFKPRLLFEGPTGFLRKLSCHVSTLSPGAGYAPHVDAYDVAIIVLEGEVETLGQRATPHGVIFYPAGEPHGMSNPGKTAARYVVFEFHPLQQRPAPSATRWPRWIPAKYTERRYWRKKLKRLKSLFGGTPPANR